MRAKHLKSQAHANGVYGGVGTRPAAGYWTPGGSSSSDPDEPVPKRFRRLRLERGRRRKSEPTPAGAILPLMVIALFLYPIVWFVLRIFK